MDRHRCGQEQQPRKSEDYASHCFGKYPTISQPNRDKTAKKNGIFCGLVGKEWLTC